MTSPRLHSIVRVSPLLALSLLGLISALIACSVSEEEGAADSNLTPGPAQAEEGTAAYDGYYPGYGGGYGYGYGYYGN